MDLELEWDTADLQTSATLQSDAQFVRITNAGMKESHPHDVMISEKLLTTVLDNEI